MGKTLSCSLAHAMSQKGLRMALPHMVADLWEPHRGRRGFVTLRLLGSMMASLAAPSVNGVSIVSSTIRGCGRTATAFS